MAEAPRLDAENPWPGLAAFTEADHAYFRGRSDEADELARLVRRERLTVLFGRSGLGKSSLLAAGLFPRLRDELHLPLVLRIGYAAAPTPRRQVWDALAAACAAEGVEMAPPEDGESLWAYFHRAGGGFWNRRRRGVLPVLVFDQFEEVFTRGLADEASRAAATAFLDELADLVEDRPSEALRHALDAEPARGEGIDFERRGCKLVLSFREDFLAEVEGLRGRMPSLMRNRYRLLPMSAVQAREVIAGGGGLVGPEVAERILGLAWRNKAEAPTPEQAERIEVDPALLSVICSELNLLRRAEGRPAIEPSHLEQAEQEVLHRFCARALDGLGPQVARFVEDELVTKDGYRKGCPYDDALGQLGARAPEALGTLVERRLLRVDERFGVPQLELTHDVLTRVVKERRDARRAREAELAAKQREEQAAARQRRLRRVQLATAVVALAGVALTAFAAWSYREAQRLAMEAAATELITHARGVPAEATARRLLLGAEAIQRYPHRLDVQVEQFARLLDVERLRTIRHVGAEITSLAADAQGTTLLVGTRQGGLVELRAPGWQPTSALEVHDGAVITLARGADGRNVVSADRSEVAVSGWPGGPVRFRAPLRIDDAPAMTLGNGPKVAISADGEAIAAAGFKTVRLWPSISGAGVPALEWQPGDDVVHCIAFVGQRELVIGAGNALWTWKPGQARPEAQARVRTANLVAFSADCRRAVSEIQRPDGRSALGWWDPSRPGEPGRTIGKPDGFRFVDGPQVLFSDDGRTLLVRDAQRLHLLSVEEGAPLEPLATREHHGRQVFAFAHARHDRRSALALDDGALHVLTEDDEAAASKTAAAPHAQFLLFGTRPDELVAVSRSGEVRLVDLEPAGPLGDGAGQAYRATQVELNRDGGILATFSFEDSTAQLWDRQGRALGAPVSGLSASIFSPDGRLVALEHEKNRRHAVTFRSFGSAPPPHVQAIALDKSVAAMALSADNRLLALVGGKGEVRIHDVETGRLVGSEFQLRDSVGALAFAPDGRHLLLGGAGTLTWLELAGGGVKRQREGLHGGEMISSLAVSPDGATIATTSQDGGLVLMRSSDGAAITADRAPEGLSILSTTQVAFVEDGRLLVTGGDGGAKAVRSVAQRRLLTTLGSNDSEALVQSVALSASGRRAALLHAGGLVTLRDWRAESLVADACRIAGRNLSCDEWRQFVGEAPYRKTCPAWPGPEPACTAGAADR